MLPIQTPDTNRTFKLPGGTEENNLPLVARDDGDGYAVLVSTWELTDEERDWIKSGGRIELVVWGLSHPPVALHVCDEFGNVLGTAG